MFSMKMVDYVMMQLYKLIHRLHLLPEGEQGKEARVVPVHKKNSRSDPSNYRPVYLLSMVGKVLERIVAKVICQHLNENHLFSEK